MNYPINLGAFLPFLGILGGLLIVILGHKFAMLQPYPYRMTYNDSKTEFSLTVILIGGILAILSIFASHAQFNVDYKADELLVVRNIQNPEVSVYYDPGTPLTNSASINPFREKYEKRKLENCSYKVEIILSDGSVVDVIVEFGLLVKPKQAVKYLQENKINIQEYQNRIHETLKKNVSHSFSYSGFLNAYEIQKKIDIISKEDQRRTVQKYPCKDDQIQKCVTPFGIKHAFIEYKEIKFKSAPEYIWSYLRKTSPIGYEVILQDMCKVKIIIETKYLDTQENLDKIRVYCKREGIDSKLATMYKVSGRITSDIEKDIQSMLEQVVNELKLNSKNIQQGNEISIAHELEKKFNKKNATNGIQYTFQVKGNIKKVF